MSGRLKQPPCGFTLIELIMVIVILGALSAYAVPRLVDMTDDADTAVVNQTLAAMRAGYQSVMMQYRLAGSPGASSSSATTVDVNGISVEFKSGIPEQTVDSTHVPASVTNRRNSAQTRLFFVFLSNDMAEHVVAPTAAGPGWIMLGTNADCAAGANHRRCWEYVRNGNRVARITYYTSTGDFVLD